MEISKLAAGIQISGVIYYRLFMNIYIFEKAIGIAAYYISIVKLACRRQE